MKIGSQDRQVLRELARKLAGHATHPRYAQLMTEWKRHNRLQKGKPMVLVTPEGTWKELVPETELRTGSPETRELEVAKGCVVELVLNSLCTVMGHPERLEFWVDTAQELATE